MHLRHAGEMLHWVPVRDRGVDLGLAERTADLVQCVPCRVECWKVRRLAPGLPVKRMQHAEHERDKSARELLPNRSRHPVIVQAGMQTASGLRCESRGGVGPAGAARPTRPRLRVCML